MSARAFTVVSNGVFYDVQITGLASGVDASTAYAGNDPIEWFGNQTLAQDIAALLPTSLFTGGIDEIFLPFSTSLFGSVVNSAVGDVNGALPNDSRFGFSGGFVGNNALNANQAWAFGTVKIVPEINGPVLAQAIFILGAFYMVFRGRRRASPPVA